MPESDLLKRAMQTDFIIFTDGACSGNPGPGGWGSVLCEHQTQITELGDGIDSTTNNRMEMVAVLRALRLIHDKPGRVMVFTDSTYVIRGITQWIWGWKKRGWKNAEGQEVSNQDLWAELHNVVLARGKDNIEWHYSRGHIGTPGNERCDEIAVAFSQKRRPKLYSGPILNYPIAFFDLPADTALPEMRPKEEKKAAYSYLSVIGSVVCRHRDWASCERRVKGKSGARFKKAMSPQDEATILQAWGFSANTPIQDV